MATYASRPAWGLRTRAITSCEDRRPGRPRRARRRVAAAAHDASSGSASGSTRACRSGSPTARSATSRRRCARTARRRCTTCCCTSGSTSRAAARRACARSACCSRCSRSRSRSGRAGRSGARNSAGWFAAVLMAFNPFLAQYAQEARMYAMVAFLAIPVTACFIKAYALDTANRSPWIAGFAITRGDRPLHPQLADLLRARRGPRVPRRCWPSATAARSSSGTACSASAAPSCSTCRGCRRRSTRPPTPARRGRTRPPSSALLGVPGTLLGRMPEIVLLICAGAGLIAYLRTQAARRSTAASRCA